MCHCRTVRVILLWWCLRFIGMIASRTFGLFPPLEKACKSVLATGDWTLYLKCILSLAMETYLPPLKGSGNSHNVLRVFWTTPMSSLEEGFSLLVLRVLLMVFDLGGSIISIDRKFSLRRKLIEVSIAAMKHWPEASRGGNGLLGPHFQSWFITEGSQERNWSRAGPGGRADAGAMERVLIMAAQPAFL